MFDEGKWSNDVEFHDYVVRFNNMFSTPKDTKLKVVVGNHDIGFHYMLVVLWGITSFLESEAKIINDLFLYE